MNNILPSMLVSVLAVGLFCPFPLPGASGDPAPASPAGANGQDQVAKDLKAANAARQERDAHAKEHAEDDTFKKLDENFTLALQKVKSAFPLIEPPSESSTNRFIKLRVNQRGVALDGFRIKNGTDAPKTFVWAFVSGNALDSWYIIPAEGFMKGFTQMWQDQEPVANPPWGTNRPVIIEQSLGDTKVMPGKEYIIWFSFTDDKPHNVYVTFGLFPAADPFYYKSQIIRALQLR